MLPGVRILYQKEFPEYGGAYLAQPLADGYDFQVYQGHHARRESRVYRPLHRQKAEILDEKVKPYVDSALTFEELQALFDSKDMEITSLEEGVLDNASYFGRIFARCGGLSDSLQQSLNEQNIDFKLKPCACDGIDECRIALLKKSKNLTDANFIEGMACIGGCIGGAGCLTHGEKNKAEVDKYGREALEKTITDAVKVLG